MPGEAIVLLLAGGIIGVPLGVFFGVRWVIRRWKS